MNIKEAQRQSGVAAENIRFYEKEGLLSPARNEGNSYREYTPEDVRRLKRIRVLRMLDMPLSQVREVLAGKTSLGEAAQAQRERLEERAAQLRSAIDLCGELSGASLETLDEDALLTRMDDPAAKDGFFHKWVDDYRRVALAEHERRFTFIPDEDIATPVEFTNALLAYARENELDITVTQESMRPHFILDGIEYAAVRNWTRVSRVPVMSVACEAVHPEELEPVDVPRWRRRLQKVCHYCWAPAMLAAVILLPRRELFASLEGWLALAAILTLIVTLSIRSWLLFYNENGKGKR